MRVAAVQLQARSLEEAEIALEEAAEGIRAAAHQGARLAVLPECTYPAYHLRSMEAWRAAGVRSWRDVTARFGQVAKETGMYVCVGIAAPGGALGLGKGENRAALFDPQGQLLGYASKRFLWHFDRDTFTASHAATAIATPEGPMGIAICADMRAPEVARALVDAGACLLLDPTALVATGDPEAYANVQLEGLLAARARENDVPVVVADKVGTEDGMVRYVGRSMILDRTGQVVAQAGADAPEVLVADVSMPTPTDMHPARVPGAQFPGPRFAHAPGLVRDVFAAVASGTARGAWPARLRSLGARFAALPLTPEGPTDVSWVAWAGPGRVEASADAHLRSVVRDAAPFRVSARILRLRELAVGVLFGREMVDPTAPRALAFGGAEALVCFTEEMGSEESLFWGRVRAVENRIPVVLVGPAESGRSWLLGPSGEVRGGTRAGEDFTAAAYLGVLEARRREIVPRTEVAPLAVSARAQSRDAHGVPGASEAADGEASLGSGPVTTAGEGLDLLQTEDPEAALAHRLAATDPAGPPSREEGTPPSGGA